MGETNDDDGDNGPLLSEDEQIGARSYEAWPQVCNP